MISVLSSGDPGEDYILECLRDIGLRTFAGPVSGSNDPIQSKLLLVTKEDLTDSEVLTVQQFLEKNGDVMVLCPSPSQ
jgi:hypothetical protein